MALRIVFLGTGGDIFVVGRQIRGSGGIVVKTNESQLHIDPGPGSLPAARSYGINPRENTGIVVSHAHLNHSADINALIAATTHNGLDSHGVLLANKTVINGAEGYPRILLPHYAAMCERILTAQPDSRVAINDVEIHSFRTLHDEPESLGFVIINQGASIGYLSDTASSEEVIGNVEGVDILILNVRDFEKTDDYNMDMEDAIAAVSSAKPKLAIITHFGIKMVNNDPLEQARRITRETGIHAVAAKDGMKINPLSY